MTSIWWMTISELYSWVKVVVFCSEYQWSLNRWQAIIWTNENLVHWRIYASVGLIDLNTDVIYDVIYDDDCIYLVINQIWSLMSWKDMRKSYKSMHGEPKQTV